MQECWVRLVWVKGSYWEVRRWRGESVGIREDGMAESRVDGKKSPYYNDCVCVPFVYQMEISRI